LFFAAVTATDVSQVCFVFDNRASDQVVDEAALDGTTGCLHLRMRFCTFRIVVYPPFIGAIREDPTQARLKFRPQHCFGVAGIPQPPTPS
jgi:hypothetical protein